MLNMTDGRTRFGFGWPSKVSRTNIAERVVVAKVGVSVSEHRPSRFSHIVRGGTTVGLMAAASGGVVSQIAGWSYSSMAQTIVAVLGALVGTIIGARESA